MAQEPAGAERPVSTAAVALVTGFGPFGTDAYLPALPAVSVALMVSASTSQLTITVFLIGLAVGQLLAGPISDAAGRRRLMLGGAVLLVRRGDVDDGRHRRPGGRGGHGAVLPGRVVRRGTT